MSMRFQTELGILVPAVTTSQMREVDRIAVDEFHLGLLQMMENAGRNLALHAMRMTPAGGLITVLAGSGGNGSGALCCARHLHNRGFAVHCVLDRDVDALTGAAQNQLEVLLAAGIRISAEDAAEDTLRRSALIVDGLIGYGLQGEPRPAAARLIEICNQSDAAVLSNDIPSGIDATTGEAYGPYIHADRTLTLAAPKTGLAHNQTEIYLADIGIPSEVFDRIGIVFQRPWQDDYWVRLKTLP